MGIIKDSLYELKQEDLRKDRINKLNNVEWGHITEDGTAFKDSINENVQPFELEKEKNRIRDVLDIMKDVQYGFISKKDGKPITDREWIHNNDLSDYYEVNKNPNKTINDKLGICQDQSIAIKYLMNKYHPEDKVVLYGVTKSPKGHCVPCYCHKGKWYYIENSWDKEKGLHGYFDSQEELEEYLKYVYYENHKDDTPKDSEVNVREYTLNEELSKQQELFFKNSKIRDEKGNLLVCYHGTENPGFREFNPSKSKSQFGKYKFNDANVNYFTTSKKNATSFTQIGIEENGNVYACYLNIVNPFIVDNKNADDMLSSFNIKDDRVRKKQISLFDKFWDSYEYDHDEIVLPYMNRDLNRLNFEIRPASEREKSYGYSQDEGYYDLIDLGNNGVYGAEHPILYSYTLDELFESDMYDEWRQFIVGEDEEDYYLTTDDIVKYVLAMNEQDGTDYDGIIISDIVDSKEMFADIATDIITLKSSNQIKLITNLNPTKSRYIDESIDKPYPTLIDILKYKNHLPFRFTKSNKYTDRCFICDDGKFVNTFSKPHYELEEWLEDYISEKYDIRKWLKDNNLTSGHPITQDIFNWVRVNALNEYCVVLPPERLTKEQSNSLYEWLEYFYSNYSSKNHFITIVTSDGQQQRYDILFNDIDDIMAVINRYYNGGRVLSNLNESLSKKGNCISTFSALDVANLFTEKPKFYRVVYDAILGEYFIGEDSYNIIHQNILEDAIKNGAYDSISDLLDLTEDGLNWRKYRPINYWDYGSDGVWFANIDDSLAEKLFESYGIGEGEPWLFCMVFEPNSELGKEFDYSSGGDYYTHHYKIDTGIIHTRWCELEDFGKLSKYLNVKEETKTDL